MSDTRTDHGTIAGLQYYRAVAALLVVLYHAAFVFGPQAYYSERGWETVLLFGHSGVELFFVLSGFIICHIHWDRLTRPGELASYIRKRLVRIYPPVIVAVLVWAAFRWASGKPMSAVEWFTSITLIPIEFTYGPPTLWTLSFEVAFYAIFLIAFVSRFWFIAAMATWGISGYVICQFTAIGHQDAINPLFGSAYTFLFGFGVIAFYLVRTLPALTPVARIATGIAALAIFAMAARADVSLQLSGLKGVDLEIATFWITPWIGFASVLAIVILADPALRLSGYPDQCLLFLGNASFAIYLWHLLPQRIVTSVLDDLGMTGVAMRLPAIVILVGSGWPRDRWSINLSKSRCSIVSTPPFGVDIPAQHTPNPAFEAPVGV